MEPPKLSFAAMLAKQLGSKEQAQELLQQWMSHFELPHYNIYRLRTDLVTK